MRGDVLGLFLNLYVGHLLGDFLLQPGRLVLAKRRGAPGLILHTLIVGACSAAVLVGQLASVWHAVLLTTAAHAAIELVTIHAYAETKTRGLFTFLFDQALHVVSIAAVVWLVGAWEPTSTSVAFGMEVSTARLAQLAGLLTVTLLGSILAFEAANSVFVPQGKKGGLLAVDAARVAGIVERGASFVVALRHPALLPLPFLPRLFNSFRLDGERRIRERVELAAGILLCILAFALVRVIEVIIG